MVKQLVLMLGFMFGHVSLRWAEFSRWIQLQLPFFSIADFQV